MHMLVESPMMARWFFLLAWSYCNKFAINPLVHVFLVDQSVQSLSCVWLCNPMDCSTPGFPVHHQLLELAQTHVHWIGDAIQPAHPAAPFSSHLQSFPASGAFPGSQLFTSGGQSIGASASVLPMNIQGWFPLWLTGLISLLSKGLSRVFSSTTVQMHQIFGTQPTLYGSTLISVHDRLKKM